MEWNDLASVGLYGVWILACLICVVSFCFCLHWAIKGDHPLMLSLNTSIKLTWRQRVVLGGAALFLLVALYKGGTAFFAWIPEEWGSIDEDGEFQTYQQAFGGTIGVGCGLFLVSYLCEIAPRAMAIKIALLEIKWLQQIYDETSVPALRAMLSEIDDQWSVHEKTQPRAGRTWITDPVSKESAYMELYTRLAVRLRKRIEILERSQSHV